MFEVMQGTPKDIAIVYIVVLSGCLLLYPLSMILISAAKGWKR